MVLRLKIRESKKALPNKYSASSFFFCPKRIEILEEAPTPTSTPKACRNIRIGNVRARPEIAIPPTPCPINIRSTTLYKEFTIDPTIDGNA